MTPPRLATWLLKHFGSGPDIDTLLGDLAEQYDRNPSSLWYWRQSLAAIPVSVVRQVRGDKWTAVRALLIGWGLFILCGILMPRLISQPIPGPWGLIFSPLFGGGISVIPIEPRSEFDGVYFFPYSVVFPLLAGTICGLVVSSFYDAQKTGLVLLFAASIFFTETLLFWPLLYFPPTHTFDASLAANISFSVLGILLGGGQFHGEPATDPRA